MTRATRYRWAVLLGACLALGACGEKDQTLGQKKGDAPAWQGSSQAGYNAAAWKATDAASWQAQIRQRNQMQNEYARLPATPVKP